MSFKIIKSFFIGCLCIIHPIFSSNLVDLENDLSDFILEVKKIEIPGYPIAFNPSVIKWQDCLLMSFRVIPNRLSSFESLLGLVFVDDNFNPISEPQFIDLREHCSNPCRAEDGRLISIDNRLYMVYSDNTEPKVSRGGFRVYVTELYLDGEFFRAKNIECLSTFQGESKSIREKNWTPFEYNGELLLAYSLVPHRIFHFLPDTSGTCDTLCTTYPGIDWNWGTIRGGTQGLLIDDSHYLSFFHSSMPLTTIHSDAKEIYHYFMGAYLFSAELPFSVTHISETPIIGKQFYSGTTYKPYWKPVRAVFPCGFVFDDNYIWVTYGRDDHEMWVTKLDKFKLLDSLKVVD